MVCKNCGNTINEGDAFCTQCGTAVEEQAAPAETTPVEEAAAPAPEAAPVEQAAPAPEAAPVEEAAAPAPEAAPVEEAAAPAPEAAPVEQAASAPEAAPVEQAAPAPAAAPAPKKPIDKKIIIGIIGAAVAVLIFIVAASASAMENFFKRTFSEPEEYYAYVEEETAKTIAESAGSLYEQYVASLNMYDSGTSGEINFELTEDGSDLISMAGLAGVDMSWLQKGKMTFEGSVKNGFWGGNAALALNGDNIMSGDLVLDLEEEMMYMQIPELTKMYMGFEDDALESMFDIYSDDFDEILEQTENYKTLEKALPKSAKVEKLVEKYINIALSCVDDVDMAEKTLRAEGVSQDTYQLEVTIDDGTIKDMVEAVIEELGQDKDVQKIIEDIAKAYDEDAEEFYEGFLDYLDSYVDNLEYMVDSDTELLMTVWVDKSGNICGRSFEKEDYYGNKEEIKWTMPKKGSNFGYEFAVEDAYSSMKVTGTGKESGSKVSGEFEVQYNGATLVDIVVEKFNTEDALKGYLNGKFTVSMSSGLSQLVGYNVITSMLADTEFVIESSMKKDSATVEITINDDEEKLGVISATTKTGKGSKLSAPKEKNVVSIEDYNDLEDWYDEVDYDKVIDKLSKTDLPSDFIELLDDYDDLEELMDDM